MARTPSPPDSLPNFSPSRRYEKFVRYSAGTRSGVRLYFAWCKGDRRFLEKAVEPPNDVVRIARALEFAAKKHTNQRRKDKDEQPYINHLADVAMLLAEATDGMVPDLVIAGILHDTIEDTETLYEELVQRFGKVVANLVREVTDDKSLGKELRKQLQIKDAPTKTRRAKMLKIADKVCNLRSILATPPVGWGLERKQEYFDWAAKVVAGCRGVNHRLEHAFDAEYSRRPAEETA